ncbi:MAG: FkbM family methyltransferase [Hyphomicrobiaceae bacterium]
MALTRRLVRPFARGARLALRRLGYDVVPADALTSRIDVRAHWIAALGIDLVVDVGANDGRFVRWMRDKGYAGRIVSFEPQASAFAECRRACAGDSRWRGFQMALGERPGAMEIQVAGNSLSSSLLPMLQSHVEALPESAVVTTERVEVARLDATLAPMLDGASRLYAKIDTQGFELPVLRGATAVLGRIALLELELSLVPLYAGQELMPEVVAEVARLGFTPIWIEQGFSDPRAVRMLQVDGIFVRNDLLPGTQAAS